MKNGTCLQVIQYVLLFVDIGLGGIKGKTQKNGQANGISLFLDLLNANIPRIAIENPVPLKCVGLPKYTQIIQPWQFGHDYSKKTCLWLKNIPKLVPTKIVDITYYTTPKGRRFTYGWYMTPRNSKARSKTFQGIANAMAEQWG